MRRSRESTMQPTTNVWHPTLRYANSRQRQQFEKGANSNEEPKQRTLKSSKGTLTPIFANQGRDSYSFLLSAVVPIVTCGNFTETMLSPVSIKEQSEPKPLIAEAAVSVKTSILFDFSPLVDDNVRKMFASNVISESWFELHPFQVACLPEINGGLYCALRVWLRMDRFQGKNIAAVRNRFQDSFMYVLKLDRKLKYVPGSGDLLGIPSPVQDTAFTGPEDPRVFELNGTRFVNFILGHSYDSFKIPVRRQFAWSVDNSVLYDIQVNRFVLNEWEKNWTPWIINDTLHFIYQFTPVLRIMRCRVQQPPLRVIDCSFVVGQPQYGTVSSTNGMLVRGGSSVVRYVVPNYYIAVTHSVQGYDGARLYAAQLILLNGASMRIVLISSPIFIDLNKMRKTEILAGSAIKLPFVYARSVIVENADSLVMAIGVNDNLSYLVRLEGFAALLGEAIEQDKKLTEISQSLPCHQQETEQQREKWLAQVYGQMNDWLYAKNMAENEQRFASPLATKPTENELPITSKT